MTHFLLRQLVSVAGRLPGMPASGAVAAGMAATAAWVAWKARRAEQNNPPRGRFLHVDGVRVHYLEVGQGMPLVLLHGNVVRLEDFIASGLIERLARHYRVIAFDRPGFGYSKRTRDRSWTASAQAELFHGALAALGLERPVVLGHSWGAIVALAMAVRRPAAVRRLVLVSGYYYPTVRADVPFFSAPAIPIIGDVMRYTVSAVFARLMLERILAGVFSPQDIPEHYIPTLNREMMLRPLHIRADAEDAAHMIPSVAHLQNFYRELDLPVTIVAGAADRVADPDGQARRLHRELPNSELHVLPGLGHMLHQFAADDVVAAVLAGEPGSEATGSLNSLAPADAGI